MTTSAAAAAAASALSAAMVIFILFDLSSERQEGGLYLYLPRAHTKNDDRLSENPVRKIPTRQNHHQQRALGILLYLPKGASARHISISIS